MNRERKYRAWLGIEKKMIEVDDLRGLTFGDVEIVYWDNGWQFEYIYEDDDIVLIDYIGKKDRNGNDIYEGDLVKIGSISQTYKVIYDEEKCRYALQNIAKGFEWDKLEINDSKLKSIEVIGNVWELLGE